MSTPVMCLSACVPLRMAPLVGIYACLQLNLAHSIAIAYLIYALGMLVGVTVLVEGVILS